jgi:hypothetical protein
VIDEEAKACFFGRTSPMTKQTFAPHRRIMAVLDALQAELDALKRLQAETAAELDAPEIIAADITADLEAALEQFATIAEDLKK